MTSPTGALLDVLTTEEPAPTESTDVAVNTLVDEMIALKVELEGLEDLKKQRQERYDELRKRLVPDKLASLGLKGLKLSDGGSISLRSDVYPNLDKARELEFFDWLRATGNGALIKETVNHQTLKAFVKERIEGGEAVPDTVRVHTEMTAVYTRPRS